MAHVDHPTHYPPGYHCSVFLCKALQELGADVKFDDERLMKCEGLVVNGKPVAWLLDNRIPHNRAWQDPAAIQMLKRGDVLVCHCQKSDAQRVGGYWLPLAVTPGYDRPGGQVEKVYDAAFVGYLNDTERTAAMAQLSKTVDLHIAQGVFGAAAVQVYHQARVGLNMPSLYGTDVAYDLNMRLFEILATGTPLVTNANYDLNDLGIRSGVNCLTYQGIADAERQIKILLKDKALGEALAANAYELVMRKHTYQARAEQLLRWIDGGQ